MICDNFIGCVNHDPERRYRLSKFQREVNEALRQMFEVQKEFQNVCISIGKCDSISATDKNMMGNIENGLAKVIKTVKLAQEKAFISSTYFQRQSKKRPAKINWSSLEAAEPRASSIESVVPSREVIDCDDKKCELETIKDLVNDIITMVEIELPVKAENGDKPDSLRVEMRLTQDQYKVSSTTQGLGAPVEHERESHPSIIDDSLPDSTGEPRELLNLAKNKEPMASHSGMELIGNKKRRISRKKEREPIERERSSCENEPHLSNQVSPCDDQEEALNLSKEACVSKNKAKKGRNRKPSLKLCYKLGELDGMRLKIKREISHTKGEENTRESQQPASIRELAEARLKDATVDEDLVVLKCCKECDFVENMKSKNSYRHANKAHGEPRNHSEIIKRRAVTRDRAIFLMMKWIIIAEQRERAGYHMSME